MEEKPVVQIIKWYIIADSLFGDVIDHPRFPAGEFVQTSKILTREGDMVETLNTKYKLVGEGRKEEDD